MLVLMAGCGRGEAQTPRLAPQLPVEALVTGAQLVCSLGEIALVGQSYRSRVTVVPNDARDSVVAPTKTMETT